MKHLTYLIILMLAPFAIQAQTLTKKELKKHNKVIEESRKEGTILESRDTVYYRGQAQFVMLFDHSKFYPENFTVKALNDDQIFINAKDYTGHWVEFVFPTIGIKKGYVKVSSSFEKVARTIIEQGLMTPDGLNQTNVDVFLDTYKTTSKSTVDGIFEDIFPENKQEKKEGEEEKTE